MATARKPRTRRAPNRRTAQTPPSPESALKAFQREYEKLIQTKKEIKQKIKELKKSGKALGFKLSKKAAAAAEGCQEKGKGRPGRKKKEGAEKAKKTKK